jgi:small subunit ribosomal protein S6
VGAVVVVVVVVVVGGMLVAGAVRQLLTSTGDTRTHWQGMSRAAGRYSRPLPTTGSSAFSMARLPTIYDLVLLLTTEAGDEDRARVLSEVDATIENGGGHVEHKQTWGRRPMTFQIDHQAEADYQLFQFSGPTSVLEPLTHHLRIADEVLRFRIIKVTPGTPPTPDTPPPLVGAAVGAATGPGAPSSASSTGGPGGAASSGAPGAGESPDAGSATSATATTAAETSEADA